MPQKLGGL